MNLVKFETPELALIEKSKAEQIKATFIPMSEMLAQFETVYNKIITDSKNGITPELAARAKRARIDVGKVRIETGKLKDKQKEYLKLEDKAIMGVHNILVWAVVEKEDKLKEIENHAEILEQKRLSELQREREELLSKYVDDAHERRLSDMDDDVWSAYISTKKKEYEDRIAAEKQAEIDRIEREKAEEAERVRIKIENEKLKKDAEERERLAKIEAEKRAKAESERIAKEKAEREKQDAILKAERDVRTKIESELEAKKQAEINAKKQAEKEAEEKRLEAEKRAKAPVKEKMTIWVDSFNLPEIDVNNEKTSLIIEKFAAYKHWAKSEISKL